MSGFPLEERLFPVEAEPRWLVQNAPPISLQGSALSWTGPQFICWASALGPSQEEGLERSEM